MSTYAFVTRAAAEPVTAAVRAGRCGGYVAADPLGTIVLFDPPRAGSVTSRRLIKPAQELVKRTGEPGWLLIADETMAEAVMLGREAGPLSLEWYAGWEPPDDPATYLSQRAAWDTFCAEIARGYGEPGRAADLSVVRNDPVPGEPTPPLGDLLRRVCVVFGLPDVAVGRSLLTGEEPGLYQARRVDPAAPAGWRRLFAPVR
jgi:hypothetical protein